MSKLHRYLTLTGVALIATLVIAFSSAFEHLSLAQDVATSTPNINWVREAVGINVRSGPGLNYDPIGQLPAGSWVQPLARNLAGDWIQIIYLTTEGWVQTSGVSWRLNIAALPVVDDPIPTPIPPPENYYELGAATQTPNANWVNVGAESAFVRSGPGQGYVSLGMVYTGDVVDPVAHDQAVDWVMIRFGDGFGWLRYDLVAWVDDVEGLAMVDVPVLTPEFTDVPVLPTHTPTFTPSATFTPTHTFTPTATVTPTFTPSLTMTFTPFPTLTPTPSPSTTFTPTATFTSTMTASSTPSPSATFTPTMTASATPTATFTPLPTHTFTLLPTTTPMPTATATAVPTITATVTATILPSSTPTLMPTAVVAMVEPTMPPATFTPLPTETTIPTATQTVALALTATAAPTLTATSTSTEPPPPSVTAPPTETVFPSATVSPVPTEFSTTQPSATVTLTAVSPAAVTDLPTALPTASVTTMPSETPLAIAASGSGGTPDSAVPAVIAPVDLDGDDGGVGGPVIALIVALGLAMIYAGIYAYNAANIARYGKGFVLDVCPVCEAGDLYLDDRRYRLLGIPRVRRVVRCEYCRSVLRQIEAQQWRYAVDGAENPAMYDELNNQVLTEAELSVLLEAAPRFVDDDYIDDADQDEYTDWLTRG